uniref:Aminopeptidase n=1 Tax=Globodera rostochiensis TaxID=31243 RepID=A0A914GSD8_GLORO
MVTIGKRCFSSMASNSDKFSKLPELAKPSLYQIFLNLNLETCKFKGIEKIYLEITKPTSCLKLHSNKLDVEKASLKLEDGTVLNDLKREFDKKWTLLTVHLPKEVQPQKAELEFAYNGELAGNMQGFYKSTYKDSEGKEKTLACTQFESTYARCAFPCWDEPTYKAQFDVQFEVDQGLTVLSNMDVMEETDMESGTKKRIKFARTPMMSTYLVAFAVCDFEHIEAKTQTGCAVRVFSVPGKKAQGVYALEVAVKAIDFFSEWFDFRMPLPKCDLIALPDFAMGGMENWGLLTFREHALLYDPTKSPWSHKQSVTTIVAHEVGHLWFGDLVTMKWWTDLWLKEGFASFMEYVFVDRNYPEFKIWSAFACYEVSSAMSLDAMRSSHPIEVPIENPNELDEIYDSISYAKSNSIVRMLFTHLGELTFQKALRIYLKRHQYGNADTEDLWQSLSEASDIDVGALMSSWTQQIGFPLVVVEDSNLDGHRRVLKLKQSRFLDDGGRDEANPTWQVPFGVTTAADPTQPKVKHLLLKTEGTFILEDVKPNEWVKVNSNFASFFRVQYAHNMMNLLLEAVKKQELGVLDRFQLADDLYALVRSTRVPASHFLEFLNVCREEDDFFVWAAISSALGDIGYVLGHLEDGNALEDRFNRFVCSVIEPVAAKLGWEPREGEDMHASRLRAMLLGRLSRSKHRPTVETALSKFNALVTEGVQLVPDLCRTIFVAAARSNDVQNVSALKHLMETANYSVVELNCIAALGQCTDTELLEKNFHYGVFDGKIRDQDLDLLFASAASAPKASSQQFVWNFFKQNVDLLLQKYGGVNTMLFQDCLKSVANGFCSSAMADEFEEFLSKKLDEHSLKTLDRPIRQVVESIKLNERLLKHNVADLDCYLQKMGF